MSAVRSKAGPLNAGVKHAGSVCFLLWLAFLGSAAETLAGELASPKGFAITYPDGWTPASQTQLNDVGKRATPPRPSR